MKKKLKESMVLTTDEILPCIPPTIPSPSVMFIDFDNLRGDKIERTEVRFQDKKYEIDIIKFLEMFGKELKDDKRTSN